MWRFISSSSPFRLEYYNPSLKLAMDIAKVFGKTIEEVFEFIEDEKE